MGMRRFVFHMMIDGEQVGENGEILLDQSVIDSVDDEWRSVFYPSVRTPEDIAAFIAGNMVRWNLELSKLEGFMMPDELVEIISYPALYDDYSCEAVEVLSEPKIDSGK